LAGATRAQADEIAHARSCFAVASEIAGTDLGPGPLDINGVFNQDITDQEILISTIMEACINETLAAAEAAWLKDKSAVPSIQKILTKIAEDESRHAALGWKTVRWIITEKPELAELAIQTFTDAEQFINQLEQELKDDSWLANYGQMPSQAGNQLRWEIWKNVIQPCAKALFISDDKVVNG